MTLMATTLFAAACGGGTSTSTVATTATTAATTTIAVTTTTTIPAATGTWFDGLTAGVCFDDARAADGGFDFSVAPRTVDCDEVHDNEIVARVPLGDGAFPSGDIATMAADQCTEEYTAFFGTPIENTALLAFNVWPDETDWTAGAHDVVCAVYAGEPIIGTAASAGLTAPGEALAVIALTADSQIIWIIDAGTGEVLTDVGGALAPTGTPTWAPDASALAFSAPIASNDSDIYLASSEGGEPQALVADFGLDEHPAIAPVGPAIAYVSDAAGGEFEIYVLDVETGVTARLTDNEDRDSAPRWSPDGTELVFRSRVDGNADIYLMNADGSEVRRLTTDPGFDGDAVWSPDGEQILFTSDRGGNGYDLWVMNPDGSEQRRLTTHPADEEFPSWSSDGQYVAFQTNRHGVEQVWLMRADGSEQSQLIGTTPTGFPSFAPAPLG